MEKWTEMLPESEVEKTCSTHKDQPAVAVLMREGKKNKPPVPVRYYCQECFVRDHPGIADHGPD